MSLDLREFDPEPHLKAVAALVPGTSYRIAFKTSGVVAGDFDCQCFVVPFRFTERHKRSGRGSRPAGIVAFQIDGAGGRPGISDKNLPQRKCGGFNYSAAAAHLRDVVARKEALAEERAAVARSGAVAGRLNSAFIHLGVVFRAAAAESPLVSVDISTLLSEDEARRLAGVLADIKKDRAS